MESSGKHFVKNSTLWRAHLDNFGYGIQWTLCLTCPTTKDQVRTLRFSKANTHLYKQGSARPGDSGPRDLWSHQSHNWQSAEVGSPFKSVRAHMGSLAYANHSEDRISDTRTRKGEPVPKIPTQIVTSTMLESRKSESFIARVKKHPCLTAGRWGAINRFCWQERHALSLLRKALKPQ